MQYLNLGCGARFREGWTNVDIVSTSPLVQACDLRRGIPFQENSFAVLYHSHLLEHFSKPEALVFLQECWRVLKPGGAIRVVVPDLEQLVRVYLQSFEYSLQGDESWQRHYDWIMLELYDQAVRERSGGAMLDYLKQNPIPDKDFVFGRLGGEGSRIVQSFEFRASKPHTGWQSFIGQVRRFLLKVLLGSKDYHALTVGRFRLGGEIHKWMYDPYSLAQALLRAGFRDPVQQTPISSLIPGWSNLNLDTEADGTVYKPDSLYMEATKPCIS